MILDVRRDKASVKDVREKNAMRAVRSLVVQLLAFVVFAAPSVVLADGRVALVVGNSTYTPHRAAVEPGQRRGRRVCCATAARLRGDDGRLHPGLLMPTPRPAAVRLRFASAHLHPIWGADPVERLASERGNHPVGPSPSSEDGGWEGPSPADAGGMGRRTRSSPRSGKPAAWRRGPACTQPRR